MLSASGDHTAPGPTAADANAHGPAGAHPTAHDPVAAHPTAGRRAADRRPSGGRPRIVVLGSINIDLTGTTGRFPGPGETVLGHEFSMSPGGKGANQAIAAARAGGDVTLIAAVGTDTFAAGLTETVEQARVATHRIRRVPGPSGVALITVADSGENTIVVLPGANAALTALTEDDLRVIRAASMLVCQLEIPLPTVIAAAQAADAAGVPVLLNPSPARQLPVELIEAVSIAVVNRDEAGVVGADVLAGIPHVITTLGADGADYRGPGGTRHHLAAPAVTVIDTTGAGDAFAGALAVSWGSDIRAALRFACAAGALATTVRGAGAAAPTADRIAALLART